MRRPGACDCFSGVSVAYGGFVDRYSVNFGIDLVGKADSADLILVFSGLTVHAARRMTFPAVRTGRLFLVSEAGVLILLAAVAGS